MKEFWRKHKLGILILIYILFVGSFCYFVAYREINIIIGKADEIQKRMIDSQRAKERILKISDIEKNFENFVENNNKLKVILSSGQTVEFIKKLENLAEETNNQISFKVEDIFDKSDASKKKPSVPAKAGEEPPLKEKLVYGKYLPITITLKGNFASLVNFINKLENDEFYANILSIQSKMTNENNSVVYTDVFQAQNQISESEKESAKRAVAKPVESPIESVINIVVYLK